VFKFILKKSITSYIQKNASNKVILYKYILFLLCNTITDDSDDDSVNDDVDDNNNGDDEYVLLNKVDREKVDLIVLVHK